MNNNLIINKDEVILIDYCDSEVLQDNLFIRHESIKRKFLWKTYKRIDFYFLEKRDGKSLGIIEGYNEKDCNDTSFIFRGIPYYISKDKKIIRKPYVKIILKNKKEIFIIKDNIKPTLERINSELKNSSVITVGKYFGETLIY